MNLYRKIMRAYNDPRGVRGVRLTADDVMALGQDGAIEARAQVLEEVECEQRGYHGKQCRCGGVPAEPDFVAHTPLPNSTGHKLGGSRW